MAVISDNDKFTNADVVKEGSEHMMMSVKESIGLLKKSNSKTKTVIISKTNHDFEDKEEELRKIVKDFLVSTF